MEYEKCLKFALTNVNLHKKLKPFNLINKTNRGVGFNRNGFLFQGVLYSIVITPY